jgi:hypothetical protein
VPRPELQPEELFEDEYTLKFEQLVVRRGLLAHFKRDRARIDVGIMLNQLGTLELSGVKVWFQLKGVHATSLSADDLARLGHVPVSVRLDDLRFWYASPEATYLVVYVEAVDAFLAEDIRDIVDREWGPGFLSPGRFGDQQTITVHVAASAILDDARLDRMVAHRSMRIDGPAFRGRPLGHRLDPLRCELAELEPDVYERLVARLLDAHLFRDVVEVDPGRLLRGVGDGGHRVRVLVGTLHTTYEYPFAGSIEYGFGEDVSEPRSEGQWFSAIGRVAVVVHSRIADSIEPADDLPQVLAEWDDSGVERVLVFSNASDMEHLFPYRQTFGDRCEVPQGLSSIAYNVLVATLVFLDFQDELRWRWVNYQY